MASKLFAYAFFLIPKSFLSYLGGIIADLRLPKFILVPLIVGFSKIYKINLQESAKRPEEFSTFNEFFTRKLKERARKVDHSKDAIISPVDGKIVNYGKINKNSIMQAKGIFYTLESLVVNKALAKKFQNGSYILFHLPPKSYHRFHAPIGMIVKESIYVPGSLFPVNPFGLNNIENLFPRNERLITIALNKKVGKMAIVKIGATFVGRIKVFYDRLGVNGFSKKFHKKYKKKIKMEKGHELGMFEMGSAVMLFFEKSRIKFARTVKKNNEIKVGEKIATVV